MQSMLVIDSDPTGVELPEKQKKELKHIHTSQMEANTNRRAFRSHRFFRIRRKRKPNDSSSNNPLPTGS